MWDTAGYERELRLLSESKLHAEECHVRRIGWYEKLGYIRRERDRRARLEIGSGI